MAVAQLSSRAHVARLPQASRRSAPRASRAVRCNAVAGYIGSPENVIMVASVTAFMVAGRFGLAPATNRKSGPVEGKGALTLTDRDAGLVSKDPAGFTGADVLAFGALGHIFGAGIILGLQNVGAIN